MRGEMSAPEAEAQVMLETQRHVLIMDLLEERGAISLRQLVAETGASEATLRRDLIKLAELGRLRQVRGGAVSEDAGDRLVKRRRLAGSAFLANLEREIEAKRAIAAAAVALCEDGDSIIINGGSTTYYMGAALRERQLNILTNSLSLGIDLIEHSNNRVMFPAGEANRKLSFILNPFEDRTSDVFRASKFFLSASAVSAHGVMEADPLVARAEQRLAGQADRIILLVDSTKIGGNSSFAAFELAEIDSVICDDRVTKEQRKIFADHDIDVEIVRAARTQPSDMRSA